VAVLQVMPVVFSDGFAERVVLIPFTKASAADTLDLSSLFSVIICACVIATAGTGAGTAIVATFTGTSITVPSGPSNTAGFILVFGEHV